MLDPDAKRESKSLVLVVDDEQNVREMVGFNLTREGMDVAYAATGFEAVEQARDLSPDIVVLDVMLPGMDGYEVCRVLREQSSVPILLLSARGEEVDRIIGLEIGADDYLTKPFAMRELVARVRAMLRRARMTAIPPRVVVTAGASATRTLEPTSGMVAAGDVIFDVPRREVAVRGESVTLTSKEYDLLLYLARNPGIVLSRDALLREVWGYDFPVDTRTVDVHIRWLRQKIEDDPSVPSRIVTVRGHGYRFVAHESI